MQSISLNGVPDGGGPGAPTFGVRQDSIQEFSGIILGELSVRQGRYSRLCYNYETWFGGT